MKAKKAILITLIVGLAVCFSTVLMTSPAHAASGTFGKEFLGWITLDQEGEYYNYTITSPSLPEGYLTVHADCYAALLGGAESRYEIYIDGVLQITSVGYECAAPAMDSIYQRFHTQGLYKVTPGKHTITFRVINFNGVSAIQLNRCSIICQFESMGQIQTEGLLEDNDNEAEEMP